MRSLLSIVVSILFLSSCIPIRIAPNIADYKIVKGETFKRELPRREMFIFEDPKDAGHFYDYVNIKYQLKDKNVSDDVPFNIDGNLYFFSFYETEIPDKTINLIPIAFDVLLNEVLGNEEKEPYLSDDAGFSRKGNWYIAIEVYRDQEKDCLTLNSLSREAVLEYLRTLKKEYLSTHNYNEIVFKN